MEPSSEKESLCLRVFSIPELAEIVCRLVRKRDNVSLLRVCRQLFYNICPFVWENTDATVTLVSMIPGGGITLIGDDSFPQLEVMQFPSVLDLSRLQVYAPHIRHLEIPLDRYTDEYDNWEGFLAATRSTPLLPNLEHIYFAPETSNEAVLEEESVNWVTAFLSPSLLSLRIAPRTVYVGDSVPGCALVNFELAHRLLHNIAEQCPRVNLLEIYPGSAKVQPSRPNSRDYSQTENVIDVDLTYPSPEIPSIISRFQCLRTLTITTFVLDTDAFIALARLPLLESLTVYGVHAHVYGNDLALPDQSFMSLRHLELRLITWGTIHNLCRQASLWQGLRTVRIHGVKPDRGLEEDDPPHLLSGIISSLADHRAPITALSLYRSTHQWMSSQMPDSLKHVPLNCLSLGSFDTFVLDTDAFIALARLPLLESLTIYDVHSHVHGDDLTLPEQSFMSLRHLELCLTWGSIHNLCRQASLWQGLRTIRIHGCKPYSWPEEDDPPHLLSGIISSLANHRAPIAALSMDGPTHQWMSRQMADSLKRLPLNSLSLGSFNSDHTHLENMLDALQPLEELKMHVFPGLHVLQLCMIITSLPRLRKLSIHMDYNALDVLRMEDIVPSQTQSQGSFCLASNIHLSQPYHENLEKIARYLYALKPDIVYAAFGADVHFTNGVHWTNPTDVLINEALSRLREESAGGQSPPDFRAIVSEHMYRPCW